MNKGEIAWQVPNGDTPPNVKDALTKLGLTNVPPTGFPSQASFVVTKTLLVGGEGSGGRPLLHAYDKKTGENIAEIPMPGNQTGVPMTYVYQNRQFILMAVNGQPAGQLVAFALPAPAGAGGGRGGRGAPQAPAPGGAAAPGAPGAAVPAPGKWLAREMDRREVQISLHAPLRLPARRNAHGGPMRIAAAAALVCAVAFGAPGTRKASRCPRPPASAWPHRSRFPTRRSAWLKPSRPGPSPRPAAVLRRPRGRRACRLSAAWR